MVVSFIIVAYNAENFLDNSLNSLLKQNYDLKKIEVILVDSMSSDNTKKIMMKFKKNHGNKFKRVVLLDNKKRTLPCGWNVALKEVNGDTILRVDAHTTFDKNFIKNNIKEIESGEDIVGGKCRSITLHNSRKERLLLIAEESIFGAGIADFRRKEKKEYVSTLAFAMYRKKVFDDVGFYNERLARTEDNEMHYRMRKKGYKFLLSPNIESFRYARTSLNGLIKQKYGNGKWIGITMYFCPKCFSLYHFVPFFFVMSLIICTIMAVLGLPMFLLILLCLYLLFNIINVTIISINNKFHIEYLLLPVVFFILHMSYGIGTIVGLVKGPFYKLEKRKKRV